MGSRQVIVTATVAPGLQGETMQSNNPVFRRSEEFNRGGANAYGNPTYAGNGAAQPGFGQPVTDPQPVVRRHARVAPASRRTQTGPDDHRLGGPEDRDHPRRRHRHRDGDLDPDADVIQRPRPTRTSARSSRPLTIGSLGAFALSMVNSFKRIISPPLVLAFAALEGVALGAISKLFNLDARRASSPGAVLGTFAAFAGTLAAYKFFNIKVGARFRTFVIAAVFGMVGLSLMALVLSLFGVDLGIFGIGGLGILFAIAGLVLGVFMLILDFDFVEQGIANRIPESESWRAAFAMTVSLVWIYTNLLRLLAIFGDN